MRQFAEGIGWVFIGSLALAATGNIWNSMSAQDKSGLLEAAMKTCEAFSKMNKPPTSTSPDVLVKS
jgi:hypothetical protein